jgi:hypothetical protein
MALEDCRRAMRTVHRWAACLVVAAALAAAANLGAATAEAAATYAPIDQFRKPSVMCRLHDHLPSQSPGSSALGSARSTRR